MAGTVSLHCRFHEAAAMIRIVESRFGKAGPDSEAAR